MIKPNTCKVYNYTQNILFCITDTGLLTTASMSDLMDNYAVYGATELVKGLSYKVPIWDEEGKAIKRCATLTPFTISSNYFGKVYFIANSEDSKVLTWSFEFENEGNEICFITRNIAEQFIRHNYPEQVNKFKVVELDFFTYHLLTEKDMELYPELCYINRNNSDTSLSWNGSIHFSNKKEITMVFPNKQIAENIILARYNDTAGLSIKPVSELKGR